MIQKVEMFTVVCDNCGANAADDNEYLSCWCDSDSARESAEEDNFIIIDKDVQYCSKCAHYNDEDELILDESRKVAPKSKDFWVECNVCGARLKNWSGSTPCCGSLASIVEDGIVTSKRSLFASVNDGSIQPITIDTKPTPTS